MTDPVVAPLPQSTPPRRVWPAIAALTAATFWTVTVEMLPSGLLPSMSRDLRVSESAIGMLVSTWAITIAVVSIPLVRLTLRVPRTALLTVTLAVTAAANLLTALAPDFALALAGRILAATAHGLFWALVVSYVTTIVRPDRLGRALSVVLAGPTLAGLIALPVAALVAEHAGWRPVAVGLSVIIALTAAALWRALPPAAATPAAGGVWDRSARSAVFVAAGGGLVLIAHFAAFTYVTALVTDLGGLDGGAIPVVLLVLGATGALGVAVSGFASDRWPRAALPVAAALIAAGLGVLLLGEHRPVVFVIGVIVWGFAIGAFPPVLQARVMRVSSPAFRPVAGSILVTVLNLGVAAGATIGGVVLGAGRSTATLGALVVTALVAAAAGALALVWGTRRP